MSYDNAWGANYFQATLTSMGHPLTMCVWVKKDATEWAAGGADYCLAYGDNFTDDDTMLRLYTDVDACVGVWRTTTQQISTRTESDGTYDDIWVPLIMRYGSATDKQVYIGDVAGAGNQNTTSKEPLGLDSFRVGRLTSGFGGFEGKIAEVTIWSKSLSDAEINQIRSASGTGPAGNTIASANCVAYYPLKLDQATHADESGTGNGSLTEGGTTVFSSDHPIITTAGNPNYYYAQQGY